MEIDIGVISALIAIVAAVISFYYSRTSISHGKISIRTQYFSELSQWAKEVSDAMSEASHLSDLESVDAQQIADACHNLKWRLSSLIDTGRWFFPNLGTEVYGDHKEPAFRGYRQKVLDSIVKTYRILENVDLSDNKIVSQLKSSIWKERKKFVSEVQEVLDPNEFNAEYMKIISPK